MYQDLRFISCFIQISGTASAPLNSSDHIQDEEAPVGFKPLGSLLIAPVTMVFCCVDGGKQFATRQRRDAREVHNELVAVMRSVLLQVWT